MICAHKCDADRWLELAGKPRGGLENGYNALGLLRHSKIASITSFAAGTQDKSRISMLYPTVVLPRARSWSIDGTSGVIP